MKIFSKSDYGYQLRKNFLKVPVMFMRDIKCCWQRIHKGYCYKDLWSIHDWFLQTIPEMLSEYKENRIGSPDCLEESTQFTSHAIGDNNNSEWDAILDRMIFLFREANKETCQKKNPYKEEYDEVNEEFERKYGVFGEKLDTEQDKKLGMHSMHFPSELPEYKDISDYYYEEEDELTKYQDQCKNQAFELFSKWFWNLWD